MAEGANGWSRVFGEGATAVSLSALGAAMQDVQQPVWRPGRTCSRRCRLQPSRKNPNLCSRCCDALPAGGAEVDVAVLFADVRGSTALGQRGAATDFAALLNRFYIAATQTLLRHDAVIDKLIGDEVMAFFVRGISGPQYRRRAVQAGMDLLTAVGYGRDEGPWLELGVAVNAGVAYVGNVGGRSSTSPLSVIRSTSRRGCNNTQPVGSCSSHLELPMS